MGTVHVHLLPRLVEAAELAGSVCVVIDVLRATTTMTHALAAGARDIVPCLEVEDARRVAASLPRDTYWLGGERDGMKIEGFDLGNSPAEYSPARVAGRTIIFTTTNGTKALLHCGQAAEVLLGALVNLSSLCNRIEPVARAAGGKINIICAGTGGTVSREDVLVAGAIVERLLESTTGELNDSAWLAADAWRGALAATGQRAGFIPAALATILRVGRGGRNLQRLGLASDIDDAARIDCLTAVPHFDRAGGRIVL